MLKRIGAALVAATTLGAGVFAAQLALPTAAVASAPPVAATSFEAPLCPGTTYMNASPDTTVTGTNLDNYNNGLVVELYNFEGEGTDGTTTLPPLCGTRYETEAEGGPVGGGPVSAWMFCTDVVLHSCFDGRPLDDDPEKNADMTDFQRRVFAYVVQNGYQFNDGVTNKFVRPDTNSSDRYRLQRLAWSIKDYANLTGTSTAICDNAGLSPDKINETFAFLSRPAVPQISVTPASQSQVIGQEGKITVTTNIAETPIKLTATNGTFALCPGEADGILNGDVLTISTPTSAGSSVDVDVCTTSQTAGTVSLDLSVLPVTEDSLNWYSNGDDNCQVFAVFARAEGQTLTGAAEITYEETPTDTPTETPTPSPSPTDTPTETPTPSPSPTDTPTETPTPGPSPTDTPTETPRPSHSETPRPSHSATPEPSESGTPTTGAPVIAVPTTDAPAGDSSETGGSGSGLAYTGTQVVPFIAAAAALLAFGFVLMVLARRRAASRHS
ncbi:hypothetical protein ACFUOZ_06235 [Paenarthrobacter sp. NPDC057355]|uniref:hypothetical protein n=1 Tax=Paenarthrobacter sp. NPDC057355 TaxID=3346105 RepID=UPI0036449BA9